MKALTAALFIALAAPASAQELPESTNPRLGYKSPQEALKALQEKPGVTRRVENSWIVLKDPNDHSIWSIADRDNRAYPSTVRRHFVERNGVVCVEMGVICGASKSVCDEMVRAFDDGNKQVQKHFSQ